MDIKIDPLTGGWDFSGGKLNTITGIAEIAQHVRNVLLLQTGRYSLNTRKGVDWRGQILGVKPPRLALAQALIQRAILSVSGVEGITEYSQTFSSETRTLSVSFRAQTVAGEFTSELLGPDLTGFAAYMNRYGIDQGAQYLRSQGLDALAGWLITRGYRLFPTLAGSGIPGTDELAQTREIPDMVPLLMLCLDSRGTHLIY